MSSLIFTATIDSDSSFESIQSQHGIDSLMQESQLLFSLPINLANTVIDEILDDDLNSTDQSFQKEIDQIKQEIKTNNVSWTASINSVFMEQMENIDFSLGCIIENSFEMTNESPNDSDHPVGLTSSSSIPSSFDWRETDGMSWVTSVKNQAGCGSCVAFGTISALEAVLQIELGGQLETEYDLSEAHLFFCGGGTCSGGWRINSAVNYLIDQGVPDESCFPYVARDRPCNLTCPDWEQKAIKVGDGKRVGGYIAANTSAVKKALIDYGPLVTSYTVYQDFSAYDSGVYEHVYGDARGGHAVAIVGYNDKWGNATEGYWICKNSWGKNWGENGYFRIKYGECGIGTTFNTYYMDKLYGGICDEYLPTIPSDPSPSNHQVNIPKSSSILLQWAGGDPNENDNVTYEVYFGRNESLRLVGSFGPMDASVQQLSFRLNESIEENMHYYWQVISVDNHGSRRYGPVWDFYSVDTLEPELNLTSPQSGYFYKRGGSFRKEIPDSFGSIVFGKVPVQVSVHDEGSGIKQTDILINGIIKESFTDEQFSWDWNKLGLGKYILSVQTSDIAGNQVTEEVTVWKFF
ncbi:MAG: C1 family peptidase [Candidatus Thermoplasmatota archaeon]|nr:C1 family peptidase [Candidatus Thermoplasmatota archaeon]